MTLSRRDTLSLLAAVTTLAAGGPALAQASSISSTAIKAPPKPTDEIPLQLNNLLELEARAAGVIAPAAFDYIARGAGDEQTLKENRLAFTRAFIDQRVLTGKVVNTIACELFGSKLNAPIMVSAMAAHGLAHPDAESATARGAAAYGTLLGVSTVSSKNLETIANASDSDKWFQLYLTRDSGFNRELLQRVKAANYKAIVLTADVTVGGNREQDKRNNLQWKTPGNFLDAKGLPRNLDLRFDNRLGLESLDFVRQYAEGLPLILKGVTTAADARVAIQHKVDAIQVSNHGGRQLDGSPGAFDSLPHVAAEVNSQIPIIFDSGIRRGLDIFKAIAAGADVVAIGRPVLYGLALGGWQGVQTVLEHLDQELRLVMQLAGAANLADIRKTPLLYTQTLSPSSGA